MDNQEDYKSLVNEHYKKQAKEHNLDLTSTMPDQNIRKKELENIVKYLEDNTKCLEVGCGNGAASIVISKIRRLDLVSIDSTKEMIELAQQQSKKEIKGEISFKHQSILELEEKDDFDIVFTIRCIINLLNWDKNNYIYKYNDSRFNIFTFSDRCGCNRTNSR